jgi:hypothetical protein
MSQSARRRNHRVRSSKRSTPLPIDLRAWLALPIGVLVIVVLALAASLAQATEGVFVAASLVFSLCEGVVLAIVSFIWWTRRGLPAAILAAVVTATFAAPVRWEVNILARNGQSAPIPSDLLTDLLVSIAWGAFAGLAGATVLRPKLAALMRDAEARFTPRRSHSD